MKHSKYLYLFLSWKYLIITENRRWIVGLCSKSNEYKYRLVVLDPKVEWSCKTKYLYGLYHSLVTGLVSVPLWTWYGQVTQGEDDCDETREKSSRRIVDSWCFHPSEEVIFKLRWYNVIFIHVWVRNFRSSLYMKK